MDGSLCLNTQPISGMGKAVRLKGAQPALKIDGSCLTYMYTDNGNE